tara:strand:+ start:837 stop:2330 length:1494 start_codon:yes stop_codon:yes gene_type:complete
MKSKTIYHNLFASFSNFAFLLFTGIFLLPYYFEYISINDYGIWLGGISFISLLTVLEANISLILTQQLGEKWTQKKTLEFSKYFSASIVFSIIVSLIIVLFTFFLKDYLTSWVSSNNGYNDIFSKSFFLYSISLSFTIVSSYLGAIPQVFIKTLVPPFFNIISSIIGISYTIYAVPSQGVLAIASGSLIKASIYTFFLSFYVLKLLIERNISFCFKITYLIKLIKSIGLPFVSKVGITLASNAQNFIVAAYITASATTIFDVTRKLPLMLQTVINMIAVSTFTAFTLLYSEEKDNSKNKKYLDYYFSVIRIILITSLVGAFLLGKDFITIWVGRENYGGDILFALLCLTALTDQIRMMISQQYYALGKFKLTSITDSIFAMSFIILAFSLIPIYKLNGIPLAGILSAIIYIILCFYFERKNKFNLISHLINKRLVYDISVAILVLILTKFIFDTYINSITIRIIITFSVISLMFLKFYLSERILFHLIYSIFIKKKK